MTDMAKKQPKILPVHEDLLEQLRRNIMTRSEPSDELMVEAADEIERLSSELRIKEAALEHCRETGQKEIRRLATELTSERARVDFYRGEIERLEEEVERLRSDKAQGIAIVLRDLKEHYRKSAIPKWDIQFLEKYAKQNGIEL